MIDLIQSFFGSGAFIPHGHCYLWQPELIWLHALSDSLIALSYYSIPLTLFYFVHKRHDLPFNWVFLLFAIFITACGTTHLLDIWTLWHPIYWFSGAIKAGTALASVYTALMMIPLVPKALALPSKSQLETVNRELQREIAERQQAEALLQQSEARYRAIVEDQTELICRFLPDGTLTFTNSAYCRYFGQTQEELIQHSYLPVVLEEDLARTEGQLNRLRQERSIATITSQVIRPNGVCTQQWIVQAICNLQGQVIEFQAVGRDITDLKQAEEKLQQSEERLNTIVTNISDSILVLNLDGVIRFANPAATQLLGQELIDQVMGIPAGEVSEIEICSRDGSLKVVEMKSIETEWMGEPTYIVALRDITERKQTEAALQESEARYRSVVAAMAEGIVLYDADGMIQTCNASAERILSLSLAQMQGRAVAESAWQTIYEDGSVFPKEQYPAMVTLQTGIPCSNVIMGIYKPDSSLTWISINTQPLLRLGEPRPYAVVTSFSDITDSKQTELALQHINQELNREIAERQQAESALQESEERLKLALEASGDGLWDWNMLTDELYYSPRYLEMLGYGFADLSHTLDSWEQLVHPQDMPHVQNVLETHLQDDSIPYKIDYRVQTKSGGWKWINSYGKVMVRDEQGKPLRMVGIARDISDRKQAEIALQESEERFQAFMNHNPALCWITDADGRLLYTNPTYFQTIKLPDNYAVGKSDCTIFPSEVAQQYLQNIRQVAETQEVLETTEPYIGSNGSMGELLVYKFPLPNRSGQCLVGGVAIDITQRKQAEAALRQREQEFKALVEHAPDIIMRLDRDCRYCYINPRVEQETGVAPETFVGKTVREIGTEIGMPESLMVTWETAVKQVFDTGQEGTIDYEIPTPIKPIYYASRVVPEFTADGSVASVLAIARNITELKQTELALRSSEATNRAIISAIPDYLVRVGRDGSYFAVIRLGTIKLYRKTIPPATSIYEVLPLHLAQQRMEYIQQALATGNVQTYEYEIVVEGETRYEEARIARINSDEVLLIVRDISDRKQTEKQLELQSIIVKNMAEGVCLIRATDSVIVYTNPKFDRMFGYSSNELNGQPVSILNYHDVQTNTVEVAQDLTRQIISDGVATYEVHNVKKDGTPFWCRATSATFQHPEYGKIIVAVQQNITEQKQAEEQIKASLKEKEILLKEIHHRVKNNLQIIYSMLRLQRRSLKDPQASASLLDSQSRIESIALIHEKLYRTGNLASVDFAEYIPGIMSNLLSSYNTQSKTITLEIQVDPIFLDIDRAISCGLIINELVSNSLKYAFSTVQTGNIQVKFQADTNFNITLLVKDDGVGLAQDFDLSQVDSLGLQLVQDFVDQLKGTIQITCSNGTEFRIVFPGSQPR